MIHAAETLNTGSVEGFLTPDEIRRLTEYTDVELAAVGPDRFDTDRTATFHSIPGHTPGEAMAVYEPNGRIEIHQIPAAAATILDTALDRAMPALHRAMPSITSCRPWMYVEYGPGQHITPHVDGIALEPGAWPRQICGISVVIVQADEGGEFYIETTSSADLWDKETTEPGYYQPMPITHDGADSSSPWFQTMPRTRWNVRPQPGTALLYGSQLTHGTEPVIAGRERKFISWLIADQT